MKKVILILLSIIITPILSLAILNNQSFQHLPKTADSGFDSDYGDYEGGGSWGGGGGSSWDDDYDNNNSYHGSNYSSSGGSVSPAYIIIIILVPTIMIIIGSLVDYHQKKTRKRQATKKHIINILNNNFDISPGVGIDSEIIQEAYTNYVEIQKAWMNRDLSPVRHLLTDEIYNMYQMQVQTLIEDNQINVMSDFELVCGKIKSIRTYKKVEAIKVILCVNCKDYIKSTNKRKVISGDKHATITYIYELTFMKDINTNETTNCPSCGAKVKKQMSGTCPYCNNSLLLTSSNLTMSNKLILHQFKRN